MAVIILRVHEGCWAYLEHTFKHISEGSDVKFLVSLYKPWAQWASLTDPRYIDIVHWVRSYDQILLILGGSVPIFPFT